MILDVAILGSQEIVDGLPATSAINGFMRDVWGYQTQKKWQIFSGNVVSVGGCLIPARGVLNALKSLNFWNFIFGFQIKIKRFLINFGFIFLCCYLKKISRSRPTSKYAYQPFKTSKLNRTDFKKIENELRMRCKGKRRCLLKYTF